MKNKLLLALLGVVLLAGCIGSEDESKEKEYCDEGRWIDSLELECANFCRAQGYDDKWKPHEDDSLSIKCVCEDGKNYTHRYEYCSV